MTVRGGTPAPVGAAVNEHGTANGQQPPIEGLPTDEQLNTGGMNSGIRNTFPGVSHPRPVRMGNSPIRGGAGGFNTVHVQNPRIEFETGARSGVGLGGEAVVSELIGETATHEGDRRGDQQPGIIRTPPQGVLIGGTAEDRRRVIEETIRRTQANNGSLLGDALPFLGNLAGEKGIKFTEERIAATAVELAEGVRRIPAVEVGNAMFTSTAGAGEEARIADEAAARRAAAAVHAAVEAARRLQFSQSNVALLLVIHDP